MRWLWQRQIRRAKDGRAAADARISAEHKLAQARAQRPEVQRAARDLAWIIGQTMRRPS